MTESLDRNPLESLLSANIKGMNRRTSEINGRVMADKRASSVPLPLNLKTSSLENPPINGTNLEVVLDAKCFGGRQKIYKHYSSETKCSMKFSIFIPEKSTLDEKFHTVFFLSGIMCNEQNFLFKSAFQKYASELKLIVVGADTSPRGHDFPGDRDSPIFGRSAGWYLDATEEPWNTNYRMYSYISKELPGIIRKHFPTTGKFGLCGHSMGGNGTIVIGLQNPDVFHSLSLLAPSCNPTSWGQELIFKKFLGEDEDLWAMYDASSVIKKYSGPFREILLDQGAADEYLTFLLPEKLKKCAEDNANGKDCLSVEVRMHEGYNHSYYFVASFIEEHLKHHCKNLSL